MQDIVASPTRDPQPLVSKVDLAARLTNSSQSSELSDAHDQPPIPAAVASTSTSANLLGKRVEKGVFMPEQHPPTQSQECGAVQGRADLQDTQMHEQPDQQPVEQLQQRSSSSPPLPSPNGTQSQSLAHAQSGSQQQDVQHMHTPSQQQVQPAAQQHNHTVCEATTSAPAQVAHLAHIPGPGAAASAHNVPAALAVLQGTDSTTTSTPHEAVGLTMEAPLCAVHDEVSPGHAESEAAALKKALPIACCLKPSAKLERQAGGGSVQTLAGDSQVGSAVAGHKRKAATSLSGESSQREKVGNGWWGG